MGTAQKFTALRKLNTSVAFRSSISTKIMPSKRYVTEKKIILTSS